jgi:hypothetical protein
MGCGRRKARLEEGRKVKEYAKAIAVDEETGPVFAERSAVVNDAPNIPMPPFWGVRVKKDYDLRELFPYINDTALFKNQWQLKTASQEDYARLVEEKYRPIKKELENEIIASGWFEPKVVWGYFRPRGMGMMLWCMTFLPLPARAGTPVPPKICEVYFSAAARGPAPLHFGLLRAEGFRKDRRDWAFAGDDRRKSVGRDAEAF